MAMKQTGKHDWDFSEAGGYVRQHINECYDEDGNFDWDAYQELCDQADYWGMEE